jgi:hypothetical protein
MQVLGGEVWSNSNICFKGTVSQDGGWDKAMKWYFRPIQMVANHFFWLKIARFKATAHSVAHPSM